jgi:glycosyltransferase involved in cell wall biosynthesis
MCLLSDILILQFAKKQNVAKRIIHSHNSRNMSTLINGVLHTINKKRIEKYATDFWACSQMAAEYFYPHAVLSSDRFKIIHNAIEAERFSFNQASRNTKRKELAIDDALVLGHIGRFTSQKNHEFLLKIFSEIHIRVPNSVLLLIGDGPLYGSIKNYVHILGLADYVHFLGIREDIPELLHAMDFYIFPSIYEGLPIVLIEAQAASLYSVTSTAVSSETAITDMISFVDLKNTHKQWAELIISKTGYKRNNVYEEIQNKNYDIKTESILMEQLLLSKG